MAYSRHPCHPPVFEGKKPSVPSKAPSSQEFVDLHSESQQEHGIFEPKGTAKRTKHESCPLPRNPSTRSAKNAKEVGSPLPSRNKPASKKTKENPNPLLLLMFLGPLKIQVDISASPIQSSYGEEVHIYFFNAIPFYVLIYLIDIP
ncbi:predicted protein [Arabidopsis lyrata subsp. lyrata]|uniref:Predicted protein n=1 Tax=Arabidopsis lyrata subsp. lyrata TaxID=81972 RepID=D7ML21_ARALL|nr:predicted protein [Arabidopsis lyrata subsp. lyrata]